MIEKVDLPEMERGEWKIEKFTIDRVDFGSIFGGRTPPVGQEFTRLMRGNTLVMSDTPAEMRDHMIAVSRATGSCLINGLGIGMVLKAVLAKPDVTDVTVVELSQDLIDMVSPHYKDSRVIFVCADALEYMPPKGQKYKMVWHDIWDNICADNLPEMHKLHRKYGKRTEWQGSWARELCEMNR